MGRIFTSGKPLKIFSIIPSLRESHATENELARPSPVNEASLESTNAPMSIAKRIATAP